jgi:DNA-binding CsgD family transcriptional regulator
VLVGRDAQTQVLDDALTEAVEGTAPAVLLLGDVGMGKTALLRQAAAHAVARGFRVVAVGCPPGAEGEPGALLELVLAGLDGAGPAEPQRVTAAPGVLRAARDLEAQVLAQAGTQPVLLALDDLQWADPESLAALTLAAARWQGAQAAVVGTWRGARADPRLAEWRLVLVPPLTQDDAVMLLRRCASTRLPTARAQRLARALGGCPLALVECERLLGPGVMAGVEPLPDPVPLHGHLRQAWTAAVEALPERAREALRVVCVLTTTRLTLLAAVLQAGGLRLDDLDAATQAGLLTWPGGELSGRAPHTRGPLLVSAVRAATSPQQRRTLHRRAAEAAQAAGLPPAVVVRHLRAAALVGDQAAVDALVRQAQRAHEHDQPGVAVRAWEAAARLATDPEQRRVHAVTAARVWLTESTAAQGGGSLDELLATCDLAGPDLLWQQWVRAETLAEQNLASSARALESAAHHAETAAPALVGHLLWGAVVTYWLAGLPSDALRAARRLADELSTGPSRTRLPPWAGDGLLGTALVQIGASTAGAPLVLRARAQALRWAPAADTPLGALVDAVALDDVLLLAHPVADARLDLLAHRVADDAASLAGVTLTRAWRARRGGDWVASRHHLRHGHVLARSVRATAQELSALALCVELDALTGAADLPAHLEQLRRRSGTVGDRLGLAHANRAAGLAALASGRPGDAVPELQQASDRACLGRGLTDAPLGARVDLVEAFVQSGRPDAAAALVAELGPLLDDHPDPAAPCALHRCRGLLGGPDAEAHYRAAVAGSASSLDPFEQARNHLLLGEHLRRRRRRSDAQVELRAAAAAFSTLGAHPWWERAEQELRAAGAATPTAAARPLPGLTPQEARVARLVAEGASTRDAATALTLSPRTVEFHLANVYRKLGVSNRAGLARALDPVGPDLTGQAG